MLVYITRNSLHLAACMKQFSLQTTKKAQFLYVSVSVWLLLLLLFFLNLFLFSCLSSMLKAEKQAIICTLYTQHTLLQPEPWLLNNTPPPRAFIVPACRGSRELKTKTNKQKLNDCSTSRGSFDQDKGNKINKRNRVSYLYVQSLQFILNHRWFSETAGPKKKIKKKSIIRVNRSLFTERIKPSLLKMIEKWLFLHFSESCYEDKKSSTIIKMNLYRKIKLNLIHYLNLSTKLV